MKGKDKERWMLLCEQAANEQDAENVDGACGRNQLPVT
jgi:hypothetical protein